MSKPSFVVLLILFWATSTLNAQITGPEQDCSGAAPVCANVTTIPQTYQGFGTLQEIPDDSTCLVNEESNSVWYIFTVDGNGVLEFEIQPQSANDDYDFGLYNLTNATCADIAAGNINMVRCNYALTPGIASGLQTGGTQTSASANGPPFLAPLNVSNGEIFVLVIDNFSGSGAQLGFTLDFTGSTVNIVDTTASRLLSVAPLDCDTTRFITLTFTEPVECSSIAPDGSDFVITGPSPANIVQAFGSSCITQSRSQNVVLQLDQPILVGGTYNVRIQNGLDGNTLEDICGNLTPVGNNMDFAALDIVLAEFDSSVFGGCEVDTIYFNNNAFPVSSLAQSIWNFGDGSPTSNQTNPVHVFPDTLNYSVQLTVISNDGCRDSITKVVDVNRSFAADFTFSPAISCPGEVVQFTDVSPASPTSWIWNFGDGQLATGPNPTHVYNDSGTYTVQLIIEDNSVPCQDSISQAIFVDAAPVAGFSGPSSSTVCSDEPTRFTDESGGNPFNWIWLIDGDTISRDQNPDIVFDSSLSGFVTLQLVIENSCRFDSASTTLEVVNRPSFQLEPTDTAVCFEEPVEISGPDNVETYQWSTGETSQSITFTDAPAEVRLTVTAGGCVAEDFIFVDELAEGCFEVVTPSAFSPNGDDQNDRWRVFPVRISSENFSVSVYNRWGEEVFNSTDLDFRWDGTYKSELLGIGAYVYVIKARTISGEPIFRKGNVTILR